jgi:hypothetical protein
VNSRAMILITLRTALACCVLGLAACASSPRPQAPAISAAPPSAAGEPCTPRNEALLADGSQECGTLGRVYDGEALRSADPQHLGTALTLETAGFVPGH